MVDIAQLKVGDKVYYQPSHYKRELGDDEPEKWENGMVKEVPEDSLVYIRVVYNCNGEWEDYQNYTGQSTNIRDLHEGWKH